MFQSFQSGKPSIFEARQKKEILPNWSQNTTLQPFSSSQQVALLMDGGPAFSPTIKDQHHC